MLSQRTVAKLETLLVRLCTPPFYSIPAFLNSGLIFNYLYEQEVNSQLLNYLGNQYDYNPSMFVRALHEGHAIQQFARIQFSNSSLSKQEAVEYADTILLMVGNLALKQITEMDANTRNLIQDELQEFINSTKTDGFSFVGATFCGRDGKAINAKRLWDLSSPKSSDHERPIALPSPISAAPMPKPVPIPAVRRSPARAPRILTHPSPTPPPTTDHGRGLLFWTITGVLVAAIGVVATIATSEVRHWLRLDRTKPQTTLPADPSTTPLPAHQSSTPQTEKPSASGSSDKSSNLQKHKNLQSKPKPKTE